MSDTTKTYSPKKVATLVGVHPNTVRRYEQLGFISPARRKANGYRAYGDEHIVQMHISRKIFGHPFTTSAIRAAGCAVLYAMASREYTLARAQAAAYRKTIEAEIAKATLAEEIVNMWATQSSAGASPSGAAHRLTRVETAQLLGTTVESIRNWERNGLVQSECSPSGHRVYDAQALETMHVIYMLRQAGYSMSAIHRSLDAMQRGDRPASGLAAPTTTEDIIWVGDRWRDALQTLLAAANDIPALLDILIAKR